METGWDEPAETGWDESAQKRWDQPAGTGRNLLVETGRQACGDVPGHAAECSQTSEETWPAAFHEPGQQRVAA